MDKQRLEVQIGQVIQRLDAIIWLLATLLGGLIGAALVALVVL